MYVEDGALVLRMEPIDAPPYTPDTNPTPSPEPDPEPTPDEEITPDNNDGSTTCSCIE